MTIRLPKLFQLKHSKDIWEWQKAYIKQVVGAIEQCPECTKEQIITGLHQAIDSIDSEIGVIDASILIEEDRAIEEALVKIKTRLA